MYIQKKNKIVHYFTSLFKLLSTFEIRMLIKKKNARESGNIYF